jgi:hypothetical protein
MYDNFSDIEPKGIEKPGATNITPGKIPAELTPVKNPGDKEPGLNFFDWLVVAGSWLKNKALGLLTGTTLIPGAAPNWLLITGFIILLILLFLIVK